MTPTWEADALVVERSKNVDRYKRNFLRQAVCELRFPTLMELADARPPKALVMALRKEYPNLELANEVTLGIAGSSAGSHVHVFRSSKMTWSVTLKQSAISIETTAYNGYAHFKERVLRVVEAASGVIDSDFFTRTGLRYINLVEGNENPTDGWINPELVGPLLSGKFTRVNEFAGKLQLTAPDGGCLLQHGIRHREKHGEQEQWPDYVLDIDCFRTEVQVADVPAALDVMHMQAFDVFDWTLGAKAQEHLSR